MALFKKFCVLFFTFLVICSFYCYNAYPGNRISVGEAFDIAYKDASKYKINLKTYICTIIVNATFDEMLNINSFIVTEKRADLLRKLKGRNFVAVDFIEERVPGRKHNDIETTYYIDLDTGKIIEIYRAI